MDHDETSDPKITSRRDENKKLVEKIEKIISEKKERLLVLKAGEVWKPWKPDGGDLC
jgi:hypothetical protein